MDIAEETREWGNHTLEPKERNAWYDAAFEIERLRRQLRYQEHRDGRIGTHDPVCYAYGPSHYECALREIEQLREERNRFEHTLWSISQLEDHDEGTVLWWCISKARSALKGDE